MIEESWKGIMGFPDYAVSNWGRVKRLTAQHGTWPGKILKARMSGESNGNYYQVRVPDTDGKYTGKAVARLVAQAFIPNPENKPEVNHIDGDKSNNAAGNLEWVTHQENATHAKRTGLMARGSESGKAKLTENNIPVIRAMRTKRKTFQFIADRFGVSACCIMNVLSGRTWKHLS